MKPLTYANYNQIQNVGESNEFLIRLPGAMVINTATDGAGGQPRRAGGYGHYSSINFQLTIENIKSALRRRNNHNYICYTDEDII